mmetsp:Transcript_4387/g.11934  ORF Transcript_4387/g.11934 Transcript_4387/m.11934 type:complete len:209 (-) Transcript_4387:317-943(-)
MWPGSLVGSTISKRALWKLGSNFSPSGLYCCTPSLFSACKKIFSVVATPPIMPFSKFRNRAASRAFPSSSLKASGGTAPYARSRLSATSKMFFKKLWMANFLAFSTSLVVRMRKFSISAKLRFRLSVNCDTCSAVVSAVVSVFFSFSSSSCTFSSSASAPSSWLLLSSPPSFFSSSVLLLSSFWLLPSSLAAEKALYMLVLLPVVQRL